VFFLKKKSRAANMVNYDMDIHGTKEIMVNGGWETDIVFLDSKESS